MSPSLKIVILSGFVFLASLPQAFTSSASEASTYVGTWKGTTYGGKGTFPDITLSLNADGSYSCSGYPPTSSDTSPDVFWTPWRVICVTPDGQTNKWEEILPLVIRFTHNHSTNAPMSLVSVTSFDGKTIIMGLPGGSYGSSSLMFAEFTKQ